MPFVQSRDGTRIAFDRAGSGPPIILVDGALCYRGFGPSGALAALLVEHFTVFTYDRRGRGESGDTAPYSIDREIEDLHALIEEAGGSACVFGSSSGAALALEAATSGVPMQKLMLYEAPFIVDDSRPPIANDFLARLTDSLARDKRGEAVKMFMKLMGVPIAGIVVMQLLPAWRRLKGVAHTLPYDISIVRNNLRGVPLRTEQWSAVSVPTLVMNGGKSPAWMGTAMRSLAAVLPDAQYRILDGQTHILRATALAPVITRYVLGDVVTLPQTQES